MICFPKTGRFPLGSHLVLVNRRAGIFTTQMRPELAIRAIYTPLPSWRVLDFAMERVANRIPFASPNDMSFSLIFAISCPRIRNAQAVLPPSRLSKNRSIPPFSRIRPHLFQTMLSGLAFSPSARRLFTTPSKASYIDRCIWRSRA